MDSEASLSKPLTAQNNKQVTLNQLDSIKESSPFASTQKGQDLALCAQT